MEISLKKYRQYIFPLVFFILIAIAASSLLLFATGTYGIGITPDSTVYFDAAKNLISGNGFTAYGEPMTHYPPGYPLILALIGILKFNIIHSARWLHALFYALNTILYGITIYFCTRKNRLALILGLFLFITSSQIIRIHAYAWSESPFLMFTFLSFLFLFLYFSTNQTKFLFLSSLSLGLVICTRYIGLSLLPPVIIVLYWFGNGSRKEKNISVGIMMCFSLFPIIFWMLRNFLISHSATDRSLVYHPLSTKSISEFIFSFHSFLRSNFNTAGMNEIELVAVMCIFGLLCWAIFNNHNSRKNPTITDHFFIVLYSLSFVSYVLFVILTISFFDANTPLDQRILFPAYIFFTIAIFSAVFIFSFRTGKKIILIFFTMYVVISSILNVKPMINWINDARSEGLSYNRIIWIKSPTISKLISLNPKVKLFTNGRDIISLRSEYQSADLPKTYNQNTLLQNKSFSEEMTLMCNEVEIGNAVVVYFDNIHRGYFPAIENIEHFCHLPTLAKEADGVILGFQSK